MAEHGGSSPTSSRICRSLRLSQNTELAWGKYLEYVYLLKTNPEKLGEWRRGTYNNNSGTGESGESNSTLDNLILGDISDAISRATPIVLRINMMDFVRDPDANLVAKTLDEMLSFGRLDGRLEKCWCEVFLLGLLHALHSPLGSEGFGPSGLNLNLNTTTTKFNFKTLAELLRGEHDLTNNGLLLNVHDIEITPGGKFAEPDADVDEEGFLDCVDYAKNKLGHRVFEKKKISVSEILKMNLDKGNPGPVVDQITNTGGLNYV